MMVRVGWFFSQSFSKFRVTFNSSIEGSIPYADTYSGNSFFIFHKGTYSTFEVFLKYKFLYFLEYKEKKLEQLLALLSFVQKLAHPTGGKLQYSSEDDCCLWNPSHFLVSFCNLLH